MLLRSGKAQRALLSAVAAAGLLVGCGGGGSDINISPVTNDNSQDNSVTENAPAEVVNPCASYENQAGQTVQGVFEAPNCTYSVSFADAGNNILTDLNIPALANDGAHLFEGSLFIGEAHSSTAELTAAGIFEGGDGPQLTIEAGATLAWKDNTKFVIINRGSTIFAVGTAAAPITFTSFSDVNGTVGPEDVQQWGGMVINGFGISNKCSYNGTKRLPAKDFDLTLTDTGCDIAAEGAEGLDESYYGGVNDADSSGRMEYVVVKHTGAEVGNGDELNGISFGGVGSNTIVKNLQVYSTYDDGIEMFGGAVNFENFVALYVRDDSIDMDEGYIGTIKNALVIQQQYNGNRCIEADGIGSFNKKSDAFIQDVMDRGLNSAPTIENLTCIVSPNGTKDADDADNVNKQGTHDPGAGWRLREGIEPTIKNSMVISAFGPQVSSDNWCLRIDTSQDGDEEKRKGDKIADPVAAAFESGAASISGSMFACETKSSKNLNGGASNVFLSLAANGGNVFADVTGAMDATATSDTGLVLVTDKGETSGAIYSLAAAEMLPTITPASLKNDSDGNPVFDQTHIGGVFDSGTDWTLGWTYGLHADNRGQELWFPVVAE